MKTSTVLYDKLFKSAMATVMATSTLTVFASITTNMDTNTCQFSFRGRIKVIP